MRLEPKIVDLTRILDHRGNLSVVEQFKDIPFEIKRVYWLYDVPGGECRGGHAHREIFEFIVAANGSFTVTLTDGINSHKYLLNHPYQGLLIGPGWWRTLDDFSSGSVCLVMASDFFQEEEYIRDFDDFLQFNNIIN